MLLISAKTLLPPPPLHSFIADGKYQKEVAGRKMERVCVIKKRETDSKSQHHNKKGEGCFTATANPPEAGCSSGGVFSSSSLCDKENQCWFVVVVILSET